MHELYQRGKSKLVYGIEVSKYAIKSILLMRTTIFIISSIVSTDNLLNYFGMYRMSNLLHLDFLPLWWLLRICMIETLVFTQLQKCSLCIFFSTLDLFFEQNNV